MKKISELMEELGFRPEGSDAVKKAFIKNLIKQANESEAARVSANQKPSPSDLKESRDPLQTSLFDQKKSS